MKMSGMCRQGMTLAGAFLAKKKARKLNVYELSLSIGVTGFEPTTPSSLTKCASQLRYTPIFL